MNSSQISALGFSKPFIDHNHILQGDQMGCGACDRAAGRFVPPTAPVVPVEVYAALTEKQFNGSARDYAGVKLVGDDDVERFYAFGHVDPAAMARAADEFCRDEYGIHDWEPFDPDHHVMHTRAVRVSEDAIEWLIRWDDAYQDHAESFPITILDVDGLP